VKQKFNDALLRILAKEKHAVLHTLNFTGQNGN
jgi:hypothetical protein